MKIVWLIPQSGYVTDLRSVTLWGTICWGIRYLWGEPALEGFIKRSQDGRPDFVISSAFPFKQQGKTRTPFFPNPLLLAPDVDSADEIDLALVKYRLRKKLKDIEYLSLSDFQDMLHGRLSSNDLLQRMLDEHKSHQNHHKEQEFKKEKTDYFPHENTINRSAPKRHDHSMTHNTIDRLRGGTLNLPDDDGNLSGQLFHANDIWWSDPYDDSESGVPKTGLFFLVEGSDENLEKYLLPVLRLLQHWGIGADRSTGKGFFDFEMQKEDFNLQAPNDTEANAMLNLSLYHPETTELYFFENTIGPLQYALENRESKGWTETGGFEKHPRLFFAEGSVFPLPEPKANHWFGGIKEQNLGKKAPNHKVYDNGFSLMVNVKWTTPQP
jgi:CRISPR-associated protein Csm4